MLFGYPISATAENWLHECLCEILQSIHISLGKGELMPLWPEIIPELHRKKLQRRTGLKDKLNAYQVALAKLTKTEQERILQALNNQNKISLLVSCQCDCESISALPAPIHQPVKNLFEFAFNLLKEMEIRDRHYQAIYNAIPTHTCPFCGDESFDAPKQPREASDHYLAKSKYPFAASNLRNLVPMGNKCNSRHKLAQDILIKDDGTRRKSFDPYDCQEIKLSVEHSQPFAGKLTSTGQLPKWQIDFQPDCEEVSTWNEVFHIKERYEENILNEEFYSWLRYFDSWCKSASLSASSDQGLVDALRRYATHCEDMGIGDRAFLKAAVFRMLQSQCQQGNQRLIDLLKDVITDRSS